MKVFLLGGTGTIGTPLVKELVRAGHQVTALARSQAAAQRLASAGAQPFAGDLNTPEKWVANVPAVHAVVHVAATFDDTEDATDRRLLDTLLPHLATMARQVRFIYTGGCWLYGQTDGSATTEESRFDPLPTFAWSIAHIERVLAAPGIHPIVIHPAMVYTPTSGAFARFYAEAREGKPVRVVGSEDVRWPLVHSEDLATLYRMALEAAPPGDSYIGSAVHGIRVGRIARAFLARFHHRAAAPEVLSVDDAVAEFGRWAAGYALDQVQSGDKARQRLGWTPRHSDPLAAIAALPTNYG